MLNESRRITVIGGGTWGSTLALLGAHGGHDVRLWMRNATIAAETEQTRRNGRALPGVDFPKSIQFTSDLKFACQSSTAIFIATASTAVRTIARSIAPLVGNAIVVSCSKGLEVDSLKRMSEVLYEELPPSTAMRACVLSGPNLALEIAQGKPSTTVIASVDLRAAEQIQDLLATDQFRPYTNEDVIGVEMAGALKNIVAIGAGIGDGLNAGENAKAAFITRGLAEIARLGVAVGASPSSFAGLAGLGDLVATCASPLSRNRLVGRQLASGKSMQEIQNSLNQVAEGIFTTAAARELSRRHGVEMPITEQLYHVLYEGKPAVAAISDLMQRESQHELHGTYEMD